VGALRAFRGIWRAARFRAWAARLDLTLRRNGGRLALDAPHGATFDGPPLVKATMDGGPGGTLTLRLGRDVRLGRDMTLEVWAGADNSFEVGDGTYFGQACRLQLRGGAIRIRSSAQVRDFVGLKSSGELRVGERVVLGHGTMLHCTQGIDISDRVGLGERVSLIDSDHAADGSDVFYLDQPLRVTPVRLGPNVLVGANAVILRGSEIGANAVVAAGAVLSGGDYPGSWLIGGVPARPLKQLG